MVASRVRKPLHHTAKAAKKAVEKTKQHYWNYMPARKRHRILIWVVFFVVSGILGWQIAYPPDRGLPLASVAGEVQPGKTYDEMAKEVVEKFDQTKIKLVVDGAKEVEFDLKALGAEPNTESMIARMSEYPFWQRFIPGSILWQAAQITEADVYFAGSPLTTFIETQSKEFSFAAQNARLSIADGKIVATKEVAGSELDAKVLRRAIADAKITLGETTTIHLPAKRLEPKEKASDLEKVKSRAEIALDKVVVITAGDQKFTPSRTELASWLVLGTDDKGATILSVDEGKVKSYVSDINTKVGVPAGQTDITIVDGREVGRTVGATGRMVDIDLLAKQMSEAILRDDKSVALTASFKDALPSVIYNSRYTATQAGLQAYVSDTARSRNMRIIIQQLDGERWRAASRETESIPSASTFKLYLAKILFDKIDRGEIKWDDPILDTNVSVCFDRMTIASTNPCAESWIAQWGRGYINQYIYDQGFSQGTSFTTGGAVQTTAADLNRYMQMLHQGTILSGGNRDRLLSSLGRHPYRYGIPTGSKGVVHDKVGFLWDYVHDAAIVQHPRGTYIMTIMTKGQSYGAIASVTREIERIMYP